MLNKISKRKITIIDKNINRYLSSPTRNDSKRNFLSFFLKVCRLSAVIARFNEFQSLIALHRKVR